MSNKYQATLFDVGNLVVSLHPIKANTATRVFPWGKADWGNPVFIGQVRAADSYGGVDPFANGLPFGIKVSDSIQEESRAYTGSPYTRVLHGACSHNVEIDRLWITYPDVNNPGGDTDLSDYHVVRDKVFVLRMVWQEDISNTKDINTISYKWRNYLGVTCRGLNLSSNVDQMAFLSNQTFGAWFYRDGTGSGPLPALFSGSDDDWTLYENTY